NALVIRLAGSFFKHIYRDGRFLECGAALKLNRLLAYAEDNALTGLEFLAGIPGTVGGAIAGNAGAWGKAIGDRVEEVRLLDMKGKPRIFVRGELKFSYRSSNLDKCVIVSARLKLGKGEKGAIGSRIKGYLLRRSETQGSGLPNAGCVFKNPAKGPAGKLIDACGLKGACRGGAVISNKHANFILNREKADSGDVLFLMDLMRRRVWQKFKIRLKPEIKIWK
ncbi:MAG: UDP-N-acetylmuramate dehydrogenase, partial [Candidatus Omnitrophica bacterium]|nr:UDP-N-acetylmuramate dehydrogenase [Candidatus Omnitrophota bacterium]